MNILVTNDDGIAAYGLALLRRVAAAKWPRARVITLAPKANASSCGFGMKNPIPGAEGGLAKLKTNEVAKDLHEGPPGATTLDLVNHAFLAADSYLSDGKRWDLVLSGVNHGRNVGLGVLTSGTVAAAIYASRAFDVCAWAFSQDLPAKFPRSPKSGDLRTGFRNAERYVSQFFDSQQPSHNPTGGECFTVNFPQGDSSQGWMNCAVAPYAPWVGPEFTPVEAKKHPFDVELLAQGFATIAEIELTISPAMSF